MLPWVLQKCKEHGKDHILGINSVFFCSFKQVRKVPTTGHIRMLVSLLPVIYSPSVFFFLLRSLSLSPLVSFLPVFSSSHSPFPSTNWQQSILNSLWDSSPAAKRTPPIQIESTGELHFITAWLFSHRAERLPANTSTATATTASLANSTWPCTNAGNLFMPNRNPTPVMRLLLPCRRVFPVSQGWCHPQGSADKHHLAQLHPQDWPFRRCTIG